MNNNKISHLYIFLASLIFILTLNATFYYLYKQKVSAPVLLNEDVFSVDSVSVFSKQASTTESVLLNIDSSDYVLGNTKANIEIIIYDDPSEPFAPEYFPRIKSLEDEFGSDIKIALRLLPLEARKYSRDSCLSVICAGEQGKYFEAYQELLQANQDKIITKKYLSNFPEVLDLNSEDFMTCLGGVEVNKKLDDWIKQAENYSLMGTPSTIINNYPYLGAYQLDDFTDSAGFKREGLRTVINQLKSI